MHYYIFDPTDFDFYQQPQNKDVLRVVQKIVDPISLVETRLRNRAHRQTLAEKAAYYDADTPLHHLLEVQVPNQPPTGVISYYQPQNPPETRYLPDGDALEWTGDYVTSQSLRYLATGDQQALDNMLQAVRGIMLCYDIAPSPGDFARTLRVHLDDGDPKWHQGAPPYQDHDWLEGANNDMIKGFMHGLLHTGRTAGIQQPVRSPRQSPLLVVG